jgi:hypothetical protein
MCIVAHDRLVQWLNPRGLAWEQQTVNPSAMHVQCLHAGQPLGHLY